MQTESRYLLVPFTPTPDRGDVVATILRKTASFETAHSGYSRACAAVLDGCTCDECLNCLMAISQTLSAPNARVWEVWGEDEVIGVVYLSDILYGYDATAHFVFFDGRLKDKTPILEGLMEWMFSDHLEANWKALRRITVAVPKVFVALAKYAQRHLGFGGDFALTLHGKTTLNVEGVRRGAIVWRGAPCDVLLLGRVNENVN